MWFCNSSSVNEMAKAWKAKVIPNLVRRALDIYYWDEAAVRKKVRCERFP